MTRREFCLTAAALQPAPAERFRLGCQTLPYRGHPLARALDGIRKAGYRYVMPYYTHAGREVFTPSSERKGLSALFRDHGLTPFMSFVGLRADIRKDAGLDTYKAEIDFAAGFGIRTLVGTGPWYYTKFPNIPKRARDWEQECAEYYRALERAVRHAETAGVTITLKPHTGITATAKACLDVVKRLPSERLKICWDAGNVSFYEGIHPDPDLPDLAPYVKSVCVKDHLGGRAEPNFPVPGEGQVDHALMFRTLAQAGFDGPIALERVDGRVDAAKMPAELIDERIARARRFLLTVLERA